MMIHERVRQIRRKRGFSQTYVAHEIGLPVQRYNKIEIGKRPLRVELIQPLADVLGVNPDDFFCNTVDESLNDGGDVVSPEE